MRLKDYPRPRGDTSIGFHWFPDLKHYDRYYLDTFLPQLRAMGASWLVLLSEPNPYRPIPEYFIRALVENNIEPVIRVVTETVSYHDQNDLKRLCQTYASWGAHYIHVFNEPNLANAWPRWEWSTQALPDRFMNYLLPCLETMYSVPGIIPVFTPLSPGGEYWDLPFLSTCFDIINVKGKRYLFNRMAVGIHNYSFNRPITWGSGGQNRWPCAQPHQEAAGCENQLGFRLFEWYDQIIRYKVGFSLPLISAESGVHLGERRYPEFPAIDEAAHAERSLALVQEVMESQVPNYVINHAFWLLSSEDSSGFAHQRWFRPNGEPLVPRSIQTLKSLAKKNRSFRIHVPEMVRVVMPDGAVKVMEMEEYLKGVLPPEMGPNGPLEALRAQAVAARTYAARAVEYPRHRERNADLCTTTHCQVWRSTRHPATDAAVEATRSIVAAYDNEIIGAYYFGHCNGHTKNSEDVWSAVLPYCRSVPCIAVYPDFYGHGVGMCQRGAMAMAERGANFVGILTHYYTGITVVDGRSGDKISTPPIGISPEQPAPQPQPPAPQPQLPPPLKLAEWPRPPQDNSMGISAGFDFSEGGLAQDLARAKELGLRWIYLVPKDGDELRRAAALYWSQGIMPLVQPRVLVDEDHDFLADLRLLLERGIPPYLQVYPDPGLITSWKGRSPDWNLFVKKWMAQADALFKAGGYPGVQLSKPENLRLLIQATRQANVLYLWGRSWFAYKNEGWNRPPAYPYDPVNQEGAPIPQAEEEWDYADTVEEVNEWRFAEKNPGETVYDAPHGVLGFLALARIFQEELGFVPPVISVGGGWRYGNLRDHRYARVNDALHARWHAEMFSWFKAGKLSNGEATPDWLFAICPWILSGLQRTAWYSSLYGTRQETVNAVKALLPFVRGTPTTATLPAAGQGYFPPRVGETVAAEAGFIPAGGTEGERGKPLGEYAPPAPTPAGDLGRKSSPLSGPLRVLRYPGRRAISGCLPYAGIRLVVSDPWGNHTVTQSGSRPEHGAGGFEVPLWADGEYTLRFLTQDFKVRVGEERVFLRFGDGGEDQGV